MDLLDSVVPESITSSKLQQAVALARSSIDQADHAGKLALEALFRDPQATTEAPECHSAAELYGDAFAACTNVLALDKHAFHAPWFRDFYRRNYDALVVVSIHDNLIDNVDNVRHW